MAHDILKDLDSDKKSGYVTPPSSPIRPTHPPSLKRKKYPQGGGGKAVSEKVSGGEKASGEKASSSVTASSVAASSVAASSVASNSAASSSVPYTSLRPPPGIQRKPEMVILAGGTLKAPLSLSTLYKPR
jgi:hypothetical protein